MARLQVLVESPFANAEGIVIEESLDYTRKCCMDSLNRGEAPFAPHLFYPIRAGGMLDDDVPEEREMGMWAGHQWLVAADLVAVYNDHGVTKGMQTGINRAQKKGVRIEFRDLETSNHDTKELQEVRKLPE